MPVITDITYSSYMGWSKIFRTDAVKIVKLTIRHISRLYPQSSSLLHVDNRSHHLLHFWNTSWKSFSVRVSSTLCDSARISSMVSNRHPFSFNFGFGNTKKSQGAKSGEYGGWGYQKFCFSPGTGGWGQQCGMVRCHGEAARSVLAKVGDDVFALFHAVSTKLRSRTQNSQFGLLGQILYAQSPWCQRTGSHSAGISCTTHELFCP